MQTHKIRLNEKFRPKDGSSMDQSDSLVFLNGYYIHIDRLGGGMVNQNNVRSFLNDIRNTDIIQRFVSFLTGTTDQDYFAEIVGSDDLLSRNFNRFHDLVILSGQSATTISPISSSVSQNTTVELITGYSYYNEWNNGFEQSSMLGSQPSHLNSVPIDGSISYTNIKSNEESYYIPVFIKQKYNTINEEKYKVCDESYPLTLSDDSQETFNRSYFNERSVRYNNVLQCFVNNNLEINHNFQNQTYNVPEVGFVNNSFMVTEGGSTSIQISLSESSQNGIEECEVSIENIDTEESDFLSSVFPMTIKWEIGELSKEVQLQTVPDPFPEGFEMLKLKISRSTNCTISEEFSEATVIIEDNTDIRTLSIVGFDSGEQEQTGSVSSYSINLLEGQIYDITLSLDAPSLFGAESIRVGIFSMSNEEVIGSQVNSENIVSWQVGEKDKTVTISALRDSSIEGQQEYIIRFYEAELLNTPSINQIRLIVDESPAEIRYFAIDLFNVYRQRGEYPSTYQNNSELVLGCIQNGSTANYDTFNCLIPLGSTYFDNTITSLHETSNYVNYPLYSFGTIEDGRKPYLLIKNSGTHPISYQGLVYNVGDLIEIEIDENSTEFILPTNSGLLGFGQTPEGEMAPLTADTLTVGVYEFSIRMPDGFLVNSWNNQLKDTHLFSLKEGYLNNNSRFIGNFTFTGKASHTEAIDNKLYLYSKYTNFRTQMMSGVCLDGFDGEDRVKNVRIRGVVMLSENSLDTNYADHSFSRYDDFNPICGFFQGSYRGNQLKGIPFEIY